MVRRVNLSTACLIVSLSGSAAAGDPEADFYRGRTITVVSAGEPGGAHAVYAQIISGHIRKYIPGHPAVAIQHMVGAGGNLAANYLYNVARKDGATIGVPLQDLIFNARLGVAAVKYDAAQAHYLGGADVTRTVVTVMKSSGVTSLDAAKQREVLMGGSGKSGQNYIVPTVLNSVLGTRFRVIAGYPGVNAINLAMERGEVHGHAVSWPVIAGTKREWIQKGLIASLVTIANDREPDLPDVPALSELVSTEEDHALVNLLAAPAALGRAWVAFGDIPSERLAALREAWRKTMADSELRADLAAHGLRIQPVSWQDQQALAGRMLSTPDRTVARLRRILELE
jgi:tripartite-type tricarboxylate transporter receptor subunit TctC